MYLQSYVVTFIVCFQVLPLTNFIMFKKDNATLFYHSCLFLFLFHWGLIIFYPIFVETYNMKIKRLLLLYTVLNKQSDVSQERRDNRQKDTMKFVAYIEKVCLLIHRCKKNFLFPTRKRLGIVILRNEFRMVYVGYSELKN